MPVRIPAGLYSAGGFKVDVSPLERVINQRIAEKKAAKDATMKYFTSLKDKINTAGVRDVDLKEGLQDEIDNWINVGTANMGKISKGGQAYADFTKQYQKILSNIERSKNRSKFLTDLGKAQFDGKYDPDDDDVKVLDKVRLSIYDDKSRKDDGSEYTFADIPSAVPDFDPNSQTQFWTAAFGKAKPKYVESKVRKDKATGELFLPLEYTDDDIKEVANNTLSIYYGDKKAQKYYKDQLANPTWLKNANDAYQSIYGDKNPDGTDNIVDTPEKAAQADAIVKARLAGSEVKITDKDELERRKKEFADYRAKINAKHKTTMKKYKKSSTPTYNEYYRANYLKTLPRKGGGSVNAVYVDDMYGDHADFLDKSGVDPYKDSNGKEYWQLNSDGTWEGKGGKKLDRNIITDQKIRGYSHGSNIDPVNAPASDVAISQYPENIQRGIAAFSEKNNLSLSDALEVLKQNRPDIFA